MPEHHPRDPIRSPVSLLPRPAAAQSAEMLLLAAGVAAELGRARQRRGGITSAPRSEGPGLNPQRAHCGADAGRKITVPPPLDAQRPR